MKEDSGSTNNNKPFRASAVKHTFTCVIAVYREVCVCNIISTHARTIVTPNSVVAD